MIAIVDTHPINKMNLPLNHRAIQRALISDAIMSLDDYNRITELTELLNVSRQQIHNFDQHTLLCFVNIAQYLYADVNCQKNKSVIKNLQRKNEMIKNDLARGITRKRIIFDLNSGSSPEIYRSENQNRTCSPDSSLNDFGSLSGPGLFEMSSENISALSLDAMRNLALRGQRLVATATCAFDIRSFFDLVPEDIVLYILLEFLYIEDLARFDCALKDRGSREKYLYILQKKKHDGVLSVSRRHEEPAQFDKGYDFNSSTLVAWLEDRKIFTRGLTFCCSVYQGIPPPEFLSHTGQQLRQLKLQNAEEPHDWPWVEEREQFIINLMITTPGGDVAAEEAFDTLQFIKYSKMQSNEGLAEVLARVPRLEELDLHFCHKISDAGALSIVQFCPNLHTLILDETRVQDIGLARIGESLKLKKISVSGFAECFTNTGLRNLVKGCGSTLQVLLVEDSPKIITDVGVSSIAEFCSVLHTLSLSHVFRVTDTGLARLGKGCRALVKIDISGLGLISDVGLINLAKGCPGLEDVDLGNCQKITNKGVYSLFKCCPGLKSLDLSYTNRVTNDIWIILEALYEMELKDYAKSYRKDFVTHRKK